MNIIDIQVDFILNRWCNYTATALLKAFLPHDNYFTIKEFIHRDLTSRLVKIIELLALRNEDCAFNCRVYFEKYICLIYYTSLDSFTNTS